MAYVAMNMNKILLVVLLVAVALLHFVLMDVGNVPMALVGQPTSENVQVPSSAVSTKKENS